MQARKKPVRGEFTSRTEDLLNTAAESMPRLSQNTSKCWPVASFRIVRNARNGANDSPCAKRVALFLNILSTCQRTTDTPPPLIPDTTTTNQMQQVTYSGPPESAGFCTSPKTCRVPRLSPNNRIWRHGGGTISNSSNQYWTLCLTKLSMVLTEPLVISIKATVSDLPAFPSRIELKF